jgi:hypothetical protein
MLRDTFMTPTAGPEVVWEQFGMSKVRSIKARGYQVGLPVENVAFRRPESHDAPPLLSTGPVLRVVERRGTICGRAAPYG